VSRDRARLKSKVFWRKKGFVWAAFLGPELLSIAATTINVIVRSVASQNTVKREW
jgi:hypothetical protein